MAKAICYVVTLIVNSKKYYFEDFLSFCDNLLCARKFLDKEQAQIVAMGIEGARVEVIKTGEVLK